MISQLFDLKLYNDGKDWKKLAVGAYGTVYECQTGLENPKSVAIKQMDLPSDIYDRCVLHDIFTEITCLEEFRLEKCVTDLYDYGVDRQSYYLVTFHSQRPLLRATGNETLKVDINSFLDALHESLWLGCTLYVPLLGLT
jgi:serine/threonine protein kinase